MVITRYAPTEDVFNQDILNSGVNKKEESSSTFKNTLKNSLDKLNELQVIADEKTEMFVKGEDIEIHEVMLAGEEAKIGLQYAVQIRNKIVEAFQEINRMQL